MGFPYRTDRAALNELDGALDVAEGMGIGAMLGRYLVLRGQLRHHARLPDRMGERLFTVDVFPRPQRPGRGGRMDMVGGRDDHRIQVLRLVDHLAEVAVLSCLGEFFGGLSEVPFIHVAERGDVLARPSRPCFVRRGR